MSGCCPDCGAPIVSITGRYCLTFGCDWKIGKPGSVSANQDVPEPTKETR